jgi:hypothetical protein
MIRKSVQRFSEKIMLKNLERDGDSTQSHRALTRLRGFALKKVDFEIFRTTKSLICKG